MNARLPFPLLSIGLLAWVALGCAGRPLTGTIDPDEPAPPADGQPGEAPVAPTVPSTAELRPHVPDVPVPRYCAPAPVVHVAIEPKRQEGLASGACLLQHSDYDQGADGRPETRTEYLRAPGEVTQRILDPGGNVLALETLRLDEGGRETLWRTSSASGALQYARVRRFDGRGRLVLEEQHDASGLVAREVQVFAGDALVSRVTTDGRGGGWTVRYGYGADGRLAEASALPIDGTSPSRMHATYAYDEAGRLSALTRWLDGVEAERHLWRYAADGRLSAHEAHYARPSSWMPQRLDSYQARPWVSPYAWGGPFDDGTTGGTPAPAECTPLPAGPGHGYPDADYDLGFAEGDRPAGIGFAYGYGGYAYGYGDSAWYGHLGVGQPWDGVPSDSAGATFTSIYDEAGRMAEESVSRGAVRHERTRTFGVNGLERDEVRYFVGSPGAYARALTFTHDAEGRLVRRELRDSGLLEFQSWSWDATGHISMHEIARQQGSISQPRPLGTPVVPVVGQRYERVRDALGRINEERTLYPLTGQRMETLRTRDAAGNVVEELFRQTGPAGSVIYTRRTVFTWDAAGHQIALDSEGTAANSSFHSWERHDYEAHGLLTRYLSGSSGTGTASSQSAMNYAYACE